MVNNTLTDPFVCPKFPSMCSEYRDVKSGYSCNG